MIHGWGLADGTRDNDGDGWTGQTHITGSGCSCCKQWALRTVFSTGCNAPSHGLGAPAKGTGSSQAYRCLPHWQEPQAYINNNPQGFAYFPMRPAGLKKSNATRFRQRAWHQQVKTLVPGDSKAGKVSWTGTTEVHAWPGIDAVSHATHLNTFLALRMFNPSSNEQGQGHWWQVQYTPRQAE